MHFDPSSDRLMTALTGATVIGMALAALDAFLVPGIWGPSGLGLVYLAGGVPTALPRSPGIAHLPRLIVLQSHRRQFVHNGYLQLRSLVHARHS